jgi:glycosyltransferase involved in cell wall biosynthesis
VSGLTIGLPVFNGARTVEATLDALLTQTYADFTLLVSDNASTDATPEILARYARRDSRVQLSRQPANIGASANFWYLTESARTPYFGWCAADDVPQPTYFERCLAGLCAAPNAALCCTDVIFVLADGERAKYTENLDTTGCSLDARFHRFMDRHEWYAVHGVFRRDRMMSCGPAGVRYGADVSWTAKLLCLWEITCVHEPLLHYAYGPRDASMYAALLGDSGPVARRPLSQMLGDIGAAVRDHTGDSSTAQRLMRVIARTITFENPQLGNTILGESDLLGRRPDDAGRFAFFYGLLAGTESSG